MSLNILDYAPRFQFGQAGVPWALQKVACTDTCIQMVVHYFTDHLPTLNKIRQDSGVQPCCQGLTVTQALLSLSRNGVKYNWTQGYNRTFMLSKLALGPVIVTTNYRYYPTWPGAKCGGNDTQSGGKTDCSFNGAHAVLVIKAIKVTTSTGKFIRYDYLVRDPDHDAPARPEKPKYDRMTEAQLKKTMEYITYLPGWTRPTVMYPTCKKRL